MRRIPDGAASLTHVDGNRPSAPAQYVELNKHGLLFAARQFTLIQWAAAADPRENLYFADCFQTLLRLTIWAERFYSAHGYRGTLTLNIALHHVHGKVMRFVAANDIFGGDSADDFRCYTNEVSAERLVTVDQLRTQRLEVLTDILTDITWAFWQSNAEHPVDRLRDNVQRMIRAMGA